MSKLIIVDVQPAHHEFCSDIDFSLLEQQINESAEVLWYYNGPQLGYTDSPESIKQWLLDNGFESIYFDNVVFVPKQYGYVRDLIDIQVDAKTISSLLSHVIANKCTLAELDLTYIEEDLTGLDIWVNSGELRFDLLVAFDGANICGGSKSECLLEMQIIMNALGLAYNTLDSLVY